MSVTMKCKKHPQYKAVQVPHDCAACFLIYQWMHSVEAEKRGVVFTR